MACVLMNQDDVLIKIPSHEVSDNITLYNIVIRVASVEWTVKHRYNDFLLLHETLVSEHCVEKDILPPKKLLGNRTDAFINKRRHGLEAYLNIVYNYLKKIMPKELTNFLELDVYDIFFLLQSMALNFFNNGNAILLSSASYTFNPLQVSFFCLSNNRTNNIERL